MQDTLETTEVPSISASTQPLERPVSGEVYLKSQLPRPEGCTSVLPKRLWEGNFYRVNFYTKYMVTGSVLPRTKMCLSQFIEIRGEERVIIWHNDNGSKVALNSATGEWGPLSDS